MSGTSAGARKGWAKQSAEAKRARVDRMNTARGGAPNRGWRAEWDTLKYSAKHARVREWWGPPTACERCGGPAVEWANLDHTYRPIREEWAMMCKPCHKTNDRGLAA